MTKEIVFRIEERHVLVAEKWIAEHPCRFREKPPKTAIGGQISYIFVNTTIGQLQNVECGCGASTCINGDEI